MLKKYKAAEDKPPFCERRESMDLKEAWEKAWSIENKPDGNPAEEIGRIQKGNKITILYQDQKGEIWYKNVFINPAGQEISEYEHIFGKKTRTWGKKGAGR